MREWSEMLAPRGADGEPLKREETPGGIAFNERRPAHGTSLDHGARRRSSARSPRRRSRSSGLTRSSTESWSSSGNRLGPPVRVKIWGCRGSMATPGPETVRTGGNTTCVEVSANGSRVILDAGTGIRALGARARRGRPAEDQHLPDASPSRPHRGPRLLRAVLRPGLRGLVWGPPSSVRTLKERISRYLSSPLFPIEVSDLPARVTFLDAPDGPWEIDGLRVEAWPVSHPGTTLGYRMEADGAVARVHSRPRAGARSAAGVAHQ